MRLSVVLASIFAIATMAGCASNPNSGARERDAQTDDPSKGIICTVSVPTGSMLKEKRCTTPEQREAERREAELLDVRSMPPGS